jgi:glycerol uptake facilitator protein
MLSILSLLFNKDHFAITDNEGGKLVCFSVPAIRNYSSNLISEIIGTFVLIFVIFHTGPELTLSADSAAK